MLTLGTFGAGYLMRPLGAIVLGAYMDRNGRRKGLILTLSMMAVGTLVIACTPGYRTIGLIAPIVVVLGRLLQGFSAGVELGGVSIYLAEIATPGHRGFYCAWQSASQQVAVICAALMGVTLASILPPDSMVLPANGIIVPRRLTKLTHTPSPRSRSSMARPSAGERSATT